MSIPEIKEQSADGEVPLDYLTECYNTIKRVAGPPFARRLSQHAADKPHEDLPENVMSPGAQEALLQSARAESVVVPKHEDKCPDRLRPLLPPVNFGAVVPGCIYRSSFPKPENFSFMKSLGLRTILTLVPERYPQPNVDFMAENDVQHFQVHIPANKGQVVIQQCQMSEALRIVMDRTNHPILVHCNKGKHRTGCVIGCFRKCQGEELEPIHNEYHTYADPKARILDEVFMELFDEASVRWVARAHDWRLPSMDNLGPPSPVMSLSVARPRA